jgi:hypothetical protein
MSRLLYERGIFRDSGLWMGGKAASAFGWGLSNKRVMKNTSICIFCLFVLSPDKKVPEQANGSINLINKCPRI